MLKIFTFNRVKILQNDKDIKLPKKAFAFLIFIASEPEGFSYEYLADIFWPLKNEIRAKKNLYQKLYSLGLRMTNIKDYLLTGERIRFNGNNVYVDFRELEKLIKVFDISNSDEKKEIFKKIDVLYKGQFLNDFNIRSLDEFEEWMFIKRESLQSLFLKVLDNMTDIYATEKNNNETIEISRRYIAVDPVSFKANYNLVKSLYSSGKTDLAINEYKRYRKTLHKFEPQIKPFEIKQIINELSLEKNNKIVTIKNAGKKSLKEMKKDKKFRFFNVKLISGILYNDNEILNTALNKMKEIFGETDFISEDLPFESTKYYLQEIGGNIKRKFISFKELIDPYFIKEAKLKTIEIEKELSEKGLRKINLDPGYISEGKLVLATTKNQQHRIYLGQGIFAEVTLRYKAKTFRDWEWTYWDYRTKPYIDTFIKIRDIYIEQLNG